MERKVAESPICRRCGRRLKDPESRVRGMGLYCYKKWIEEKSSTKLFRTSPLQIDKNTL